MPKAVKKVVAKKPAETTQETPARPQKPPRVLDPAFVTPDEQEIITEACDKLLEEHGITLRRIRAVVDQLIYETPGFEAK